MFHIGTLSLKMDVKRAAWQNLPSPQFLKKWIISRLAGSSPEVRGCLLTWAGISIKTAPSNCSFEVTHITDGTVNIAPTCLGTFLPTLLYFFSFSRDAKYIICHTRFIKRGQLSINPAITHAITLIILRWLICVIWRRECWDPKWNVLHSYIWFCVSFLTAYSLNRVSNIQSEQ